MEGSQIKTANERFERYQGNERERFLLRLFITGTTPRSCRAVANLKRFCEDYLGDMYQLEVVDIYQHPELAREEQIIAVPTLVKKQPLPRRLMLGDLSDPEWLKKGLGMTN